jgi:uncharacterized SAM-binding protein YcdF (DUF218 family)
VAARHSLKSKLLVVTAVVVIATLTHSVWMGWMGARLVHSDPPFHADVIVTLAGDPYGHRILKAAELVKSGFAPKVLVSGPPGFYDLHESDLAIQFVLRHGYPADWFIAVPHDAHSTEEEGHALYPELIKLHAHRVIVVTTDYHSARARRLLSSSWPGIEIRMVTAPDDFFSAHGWWHNREGRKIFLLEWVKTLASFARI